jgi:hypothetical protein
MFINRQQAFIAAKAWLEDAQAFREQTGKECPIRTDIAAGYMVKSMARPTAKPTRPAARLKPAFRGASA